MLRQILSMGTAGALAALALTSPALADDGKRANLGPSDRTSQS